MRILVFLIFSLIVVFAANGEEKRSPDSGNSTSTQTTAEIEAQNSLGPEPSEEPIYDLEPIDENDGEDIESEPLWDEL